MPYPSARWGTRGAATGRASALVLGILLFCSHPAAAQWRLEAWFGTALNAPSPVTFSQAGEPDITTTGHWSTQPGKATWYYAGRVAKWSGDAAWAFEYMHHKVYLDNPPPEVDYFRITNGVNNLLGERLWRRKGWEFGVGAGPVLVVPISKVRGQPLGQARGIFQSHYDFGGGTLQANLARRIRILPFAYGSLSLKATMSYLDVDIADGKAKLMNYALHLQYGLSLQSRAERK